MPKFERENRYTVIKNKDIEKYLSDSEIVKLHELTAMIDFRRQQDGRDLLRGVVVEKDWPEYEPVWSAIELRIQAT